VTIRGRIIGSDYASY